MSLIDIAIVFVIVVSFLIGLYRGFVKEVFSLFSWLAALWIAYHYAVEGGVYLEPYIGQPTFRVVVAFAVIFVVSLLLISMASYLILRFIQLAGAARINRSLGGAFGLARGVVVVSLLILGSYFMGFPSQPWWQDSVLVELFEPVNGMIKIFLPQDIVEQLSSEIT
ncbi:MAG: CvpA family protein [Gammaproteobacteria bacterium]|nr:CvpA family protein [Gammaproteobacteria bacterium]